MKTIVLLTAVMLLLISSSQALADEPKILPGVKIKDGLNNINLSYDTNPTMVDWNNDGLKDLLVGEFTQGYITLYLNQGTNLNPMFDGGVKVESNGTPITVTYG